MPQLYTLRQVPAHEWLLLGTEAATSLQLTTKCTVVFSDGSTAVLNPGVNALLPDGVTTTFDRSQWVWVPYVIKGETTLRIIKEADLPVLSQTTDYAPLGRVELHGVVPYQPDSYLTAGGLGNAQPTTITVVSSSAAKALSLGSSGTPPAGWQTTGFNDSGWAAAVTGNTNTGVYAPSPGATFIWPESAPATAPESCLLRQHFTIPAGTISSASITVHADDYVLDGTINGHAIAALVNNQNVITNQGITTTSIPVSYLVNGDNVFAVEGVNGNPPSPNTSAGISYTITVILAGSGDIVHDPTTAEGDLIYRHSSALTALPIGSSGQVLTVVTGDPAWAAAATVTSVALTAPSEISVSGSPVTTSGTLALSWANETTNKVFAAPNGSTGTPSFRALVAADIPNLPASQITSGQLAQARGGTGIDSSGATDGQLLIGQTSDHSFGLATLTAGTGITITNAGHSITVAASGGGGSGTVTSVAVSAPAEISVSGSPVTTSGTITLSWASQSANQVFAGPTSGGSATPGFRALVAADIPNLAASKITSGQLAQAQGGTGKDTSGATDGQLLIGKTSDHSLNLATLSAGTGIAITNSGGGISIASTVTAGAQLYTLTSPPTFGSGAWSWINQGSSTITDQTNGLTLANTASEGSWHQLVKSAPGTPYTITAAFLMLSHANAADEVGLVFRESSSGKCHLLSVSAAATIYSRKLTNATTFSADYTSDSTYGDNNGGYTGIGKGPIWVRIQDNGTNRILSFSVDGQYWATFDTRSRTDFMTADQVGWFIRATSSLVAATMVSWAQT